MRIPITMCHGTNRGPYFMPRPRWRETSPLDAAHFEGFLKIASDLGFRSISYDDLDQWRTGDGRLPDRPIMFDFDHPNKSIGYEIWPLMQRYGFSGNLFINTSPMEKNDARRFLTWEELRDIRSDGWHIGSHLHNHFDLAYLGRKDPSGALIREQMQRCDGILKQQLGVESRDFAFTSTTWSRVAEDEVKKRYRFGRLWIIGAHYDTDDGRVRYADLVGVPGPDEEDGGPPFAARYITGETNPHRLPSMELEKLIFEHDAFRRYLESALVAEEAQSA